MSFDSYQNYLVFSIIMGLYFILSGLLYLRGLRIIIDPSLLLFYFGARIFMGKEWVVTHKGKLIESGFIKSIVGYYVFGGIFWVLLA